jgi:hypothetical protein
MNEIKKIMQDMKEGINKDKEILKNNQCEMNSSISQTKISTESFLDRVEQVENRESGKEEKIDLDQTVKIHKKG